ncbi:MAG: ATP-binding protein [Candidatus Muiribacteriota bacterium]
MKKLPIGISTLDKIINGDCVYVDKTQTALNLIEDGGGYYFLSRPRRFGKSLFLDTLKEIFYGNKELFKGLHIYDKYSFEKHPVINISFGSGKINSKDELNSKIMKIIIDNKRDLNLNFENLNNISQNFEELIYQAYKKYNKRVVILVDEYDKPILDNIEDKEIAREIRDELKGFYSVIKDSDEYLKFVFLTGVSKFSKVSLFSGLNNLNDITLNPNYATICGYTQTELEEKFREHLKGQDFDKIREWYNGYKWLGESVYNPFDILLFINNNFDYRNYWFSTATPTFLLKFIEKNNYFIPDFENIILDDNILGSFDVDNINLETLMWQTGYLTIVEKIDFFDEMRYKLDIPNKEVRLSLMSSISEFLTKIRTTEHKDKIKLSLFNKDMESFENSLISLYASIANNNFTNNKMYEYEGYYVSVFYSYIKALGQDIKNEDPSNKGRIDITIILPETIYIMEFKTDGGGALKQIKEKKYYEKYLSTGKEIILVGIEFDKKNRNISKVEYEKLR